MDHGRKIRCHKLPIILKKKLSTLALFVDLFLKTFKGGGSRVMANLLSTNYLIFPISPIVGGVASKAMLKISLANLFCHSCSCNLFLHRVVVFTMVCYS